MSRVTWAVAIAPGFAGLLQAAETGPPAGAEAGPSKLGNVFYIATGSETVPPAASPYWLGVEVFTVGPALRTQLGLGDKEGLVVEAITPGGPAEKGGVKLYDVLVKAGGKKKIEDVGNLVAAMNEAKDGKLALDVIRASKPLSVTVTLENDPRAGRDGRRRRPIPRPWPR